MNSSSPLHLKVPGSTSNLGPGFDLFGLALDVSLEVSLLGPAAGSVHELTRSSGTASEWPNTPENILFVAFDRVARELGVASQACRFEVHSDIPLARGLGSSGAACAAGLLLGNAFHSPNGGGLDEGELVRIGVELEGHPENSSASLLGGGVLCLPEESGKVHVVAQPISERIGFVLAWPDARVTTRAARQVLPESVPFATAVENPRRLALLLEGMREGQPELLRAGIRDGLHVPHRLPLIPGGSEALAASENAGAWCSTISGSGSALVALTPHEKAQDVAEAMRSSLLRHNPEATARPVAIVSEAPRVRGLEAPSD